MSFSIVFRNRHARELFAALEAHLLWYTVACCAVVVIAMVAR